MKLINALLLGGTLLFPAQAIAEQKPEAKQESKAEFFVSMQCMNKMVFRGLTFSEDPILNSTLLFTRDGLSVIGFINYDTRKGQVNELDIMLEYARPVGDFTVTAGFGYYGFIGQSIDKTQELYVTATLEKLLKPSLKLFFDYDEGSGIYGEFSMSHYFDLGKVDVSASVSLGFNHKYFRENTGFSHTALNLTMPVEIAEGINVVPKITYSKSLDEEEVKDQFYGGISLDMTL